LARHDEALAEMARAREIDPLSLVTNALEGQTLLFAGQYDRALDRLNKTLEMDPNFWVAHIQLSRLYIQQGDLDAAVTEGEKALQASGGNSEATSLIGYARARAGQPEKALESLEKLRAMQATGRVADFNVAMVLNGLGKTDDAMSSLKNALENRDARLILLKVDKRWDHLRSDPRFIEIIRALNLN